MANSDDIFKDLLFATLKEQRAKRRWGIFFKLLFFIVLFLTIWLVWPENNTLTANKTSHTALIDVNGVIDADSQANADNIITGIDDAFKDKYAKGIILRIDSPGGSPVQSSDVYHEIMRQRALHPHTKIYAVCTDICTSAAYYMASATNKIYANPASLVGSIGVLIDGFGFVDSMQKLGIQRRLLTAGEHKGFLDPFSPMKPEDQQLAQTMLDQIHQQFINDVKKGRGERLKITSDTFSGLAWTGNQALGQGLIDGYASANDIARNMFNAETIVDYTVKPNPFDQFAQRFGASFATHLGAIAGLGEQGIREQTVP